MRSFQQQPTHGDILIVDDTQPNLRILSTMLARQGYEVRSASDGPTALSLAAAKPPDLILLDILMPEMSGYTVCEKLKADAQTSDIPVIFLSALDEVTNKVQGFAEGGIDYITKPFQVKEVLARVQTHLAVHNLQKQLKTQNAQLQQEIAARRRVEAVLQKANVALEQEVAERTAALTQANTALKAESAGRKRAEAALEEHIRFELLLTDLSAIFVNLPTANADDLIKEGLQHIIDFMALDRCTLIEFSEDNTELLATHCETAQQGIPPLHQETLSVRQLPWFAHQLQRGEIIMMPDLPDDLPDEAAQERAYCRQTGLQSGLAIPLIACGSALGTLACGTLHHKHVWPAELLPRLRVVGELFANALMCKRMESQLRMHTQHLETLVTEKVRELEMARAKMIQTAKLASLGEMANGIAHELNQPLTAMLFEAEYLKATAKQVMNAGKSIGVLSAQEIYHIGESLAQDIERSRRITDYLRAFSDIAKGDVVKTDVNRAIEDSFTLTEARLSQHAISVERQLNPSLPLVQANPHKLEQVFANLISNAEYALEEMGRRVTAGEVNRNDYQKTLTVSTYIEGQHVIAQVRDNGCGIPQTAHAHIFEPFFTTKPVGEGSGLGLSICHGFVTESGGQITFESEENQGTTFTLRFPLAIANFTAEGAER